MTEAKPLSKERRAEIEADVHRRVLELAQARGNQQGDEIYDPILDAFVDLLRAEQYWREMFYRTPEYATDEVGDYCPLCEVSMQKIRGREAMQHRPECPRFEVVS